MMCVFDAVRGLWHWHKQSLFEKREVKFTMKRRIFRKTTTSKTEDQAEILDSTSEEDAANTARMLELANAEPLRLGVSLQHLSSLHKKTTFAALYKYVKATTRRNEGHRSYAMHLLNDPSTRSLVSLQPDIFVSFSWSARIKPVMAALRRKLPTGQEDMFVWMDVVIVDHHVEQDIGDLGERINEFENILRWIGKEFVFMSPSASPLALTRSWCLLEMYYIHLTNVACVPCMTEEDEKTLIQNMRNGRLGFDALRIFFKKKIKIEAGKAHNPQEQEAILKLMMRDLGVVSATKVIQFVVQKCLLDVAEQALKVEVGESHQRTALLNTIGALYRAVGESTRAQQYYEQALDNARKLEKNDPQITSQLNALAELLRETGDYKKAETLCRESLAMYQKLRKPNHPDIAIALNNLHVILCI